MRLETDIGDAPQVSTLYPSQIYLNMTSKTNTTETESWEKKWRKSSNKIHICRTKFPKNIEHRQRSSRKTPSWPWSPKPWPHTCSSNTTTNVKETLGWKISLRGGNHSSKRRRSESRSYNINENYRNKNRDKDSKCESENKSEGTRTESESKLMTVTTDLKKKQWRRRMK